MDAGELSRCSLEDLHAIAQQLLGEHVLLDAAASDRQTLERAIVRLTLEELKQRAAALGIKNPRGHKGHKATWVDAILGRGEMEVDGEHEGNPCVGYTLVSGERRRVYESGNGARYYIVPRSGRKAYRVSGAVEPLGADEARAAAAAGEGAAGGTPAASAARDGEMAALAGSLSVSDRKPRPAVDRTSSGTIQELLDAAPVELVRSALVLHPCPPTRRPSHAESSLAHARLLSRLDFFGLRERAVDGDGNCQFRALADQMYGHQREHLTVRRLVVEQLRAAPSAYRDFVLAEPPEPGAAGASEPFDAYVSRMAQPGAWGDHVTLQACADRLGAEISLVTSFAAAAAEAGGAEDSAADAVITVMPRPHCRGVATPPARMPSVEADEGVRFAGADAFTRGQAAGGAHTAVGAGPKPPAVEAGADEVRTLWLAFFAEVHYSSIEPKD